MVVSTGRPMGGTAWNVWRGVIGFGYLAAAVFNGIYTLPRTDQPDLLDGYADGAWLPFLEDLTRDVIMPNDSVVMVAVILFEVAAGVMILSRDHWVDLGVGTSLVWVLAILPFLAWPYLITNVVLAVLQGIVLLRRYDAPVWTLAARSLSTIGSPRPPSTGHA